MMPAGQMSGDALALDKAHPLYWAGPDLARAGLLTNADWVVDRSTRAAGMIPNQALKPAAAIMAAMHRNALDYIRQAPVIVLAASFGGKTARASERTFMAQNFKALCERGPKLKDVLAAYRLALPWRLLAPSALEPGALDLVRLLDRTLSASDLAQVLSIRRDGHRTWLREMNDFYRMMRRRGVIQEIGVLRWAAMALAQHVAAGNAISNTDTTGFPHTACGGGEVADWLIANPAAFNPRWTWHRAQIETMRWHEMLRAAELDAAHDPAVLDAEIDYAPLPNVPVTVGEFQFVPLRSIRALHLDGAAMHHCVASYAPSVKAGWCRIYSIRRRQADGSDTRVATLELMPSGAKAQLKGPCNRAVSGEVSTAAKVFSHDCMTSAAAVQVALFRKSA